MEATMTRKPRRDLRRAALPAELPAEAITVLVDTREQSPFDLSPMRMQTATLASGDYSIRGLESVVAIERKSLGDLVACCGVERERFDREVQRLLAYPVRAVVVEASWSDLERGEWRGQVKPAAVVGSCLGWCAMGLPVIPAGSRLAAQEHCGRLLAIAARREWRRLRTLAQEFKGDE